MLNSFRISTLMTWICCGTILSACSLAPHYQRPDIKLGMLPEISEVNEDSTLTIMNHHLGWKNYFQDKRLQQLIELALSNNHNLKIASLNTEIVQRQFSINQTALLPNVTATASGQTIYRDHADSQNYSTRLGISAFELDLFGRIKSLSDQALNQYLAQKETQDAIHIALVASVAKSYFNWRVAEERQILLKQIVLKQQSILKLTQLKYREGMASEIDVQAAIVQLSTAENNLSIAQDTIKQAKTALTLLIGTGIPENLVSTQTLEQQFHSYRLPSGLDAHILLNRPDVRSSEYMLRAANANIGAARAAFFPRISLTGALEYASNDLQQLFNTNSPTWSFIPQINIPIFSWGQNKKNLDIAYLRKNVAIAQYEQTLQTAFKEVLDILNSKQSLEEQYTAIDKATQAQSKQQKLVESKFKHGLVSVLALLEAEKNYANLAQQRLQIQLAILQNQVDLYKSLGGGLSALSQ